MEAIPCSNCEAAETECVVKESRRGRYPRRSKKPTSVTNRAPRISTTENSPEEHPLPRIELNAFPAETNAASAFMEEPMQSQEDEVYLGESTMLSSVHNTGDSPRYRLHVNSHLRYPMPEAPRVPKWETYRRKCKIEALVAQGALLIPAPYIIDQLFAAYFTWFHPCFPILNREEVILQNASGTLSPMLCQAILFIAVIHCDLNELQELGYGNREQAKHLFYHRAKDLYDADYDDNHLVTLQVMFLLSFWRASPQAQKDSRYWLSGAISLAQSKAMHRQFAQPNHPNAKLRRLVWWSLYVRDYQCAAALGLPTRIRDEDFDVTPLALSDLQETTRDASSDTAITIDNSLAVKPKVLFPIEMAKLARFLGRIVHKEYMPQSSTTGSRSSLKDDLDKWLAELPAPLRLMHQTKDLFVGTIHMAYNNLLILLYRSAFIAGKEDDPEHGSEIAYQAACRIGRIAEDLLAERNIGFGQIHLITCLFNALCIHTINLRRVEGTSRLVTEYRAKICLYGLKELQNTWEVTNWVLQLFFQYLDHSVARRLETSQNDEESQGNQIKNPDSLTIQTPSYGVKTGQNSPAWLNILDTYPDSADSLSKDDTNIFKQAIGEEYADFPLGAISDLDGIMPMDLELLANCLT